jgi:hypothetical protein
LNDVGESDRLGRPSEPPATIGSAPAGDDPVPPEVGEDVEQEPVWDVLAVGELTSGVAVLTTACCEPDRGANGVRGACRYVDRSTHQ